MLNGGYSGGAGAGDGGFRRQEERMQGARNKYQDDPAKQRNDQELAEKRRMFQSEETAKASAEWWEVACYVQATAGY